MRTPTAAAADCRARRSPRAATAVAPRGHAARGGGCRADATPRAAASRRADADHGCAAAAARTPLAAGGGCCADAGRAARRVLPAGAVVLCGRWVGAVTCVRCGEEGRELALVGVLSAVGCRPAGLRAWLLEAARRPRGPRARRPPRGAPGRRAAAGRRRRRPGARTVLVDGVTGPVDPQALDRAIRDWDGAAGDPEARPEPVEIPTTYDGDDLDDVARLAGLTTREVVGLHTGTDLTVAFCGFSAGFAYLTGMPPELHLPRLDTAAHRRPRRLRRDRRRVHRRLPETLPRRLAPARAHEHRSLG